MTDSDQMVQDLIELGYTPEARPWVGGHPETPTVHFDVTVEPAPPADYDQLLWDAFVAYRKLLAKDGFRLTLPTFTSTGFSATVQALPIHA